MRPSMRPSLARFKARLKRIWGWFVAAWGALHVERQGKYSIERLRQLHDYHKSQSLARSWLIIALTPLPCLAAITLLDAIPLQPPKLGLRHSHLFWLRVFLMTWMTDAAVMVQLRHVVTRLGVTRFQIVAVSTTVAAVGASNGAVLAWLIGFPLPFTIAVGSLGAGTVFFICLVALWGRILRSNAEVRIEVVAYAMLVVKQIALIYIYPVFSYVFNRLDSYQQAAFALLLPLLKIALKNWVNSSVIYIGDLQPEMIVFNVEIFHALYVAYSMQTATSQSTIAVLMAVDFLQACSSFQRISKLARTKTVEHEILSSNAAASLCESFKTWSQRRQRVVPLQAMSETHHAGLLRLALHIIDTDASVRQRCGTRPTADPSSDQGRVAVTAASNAQLDASQRALTFQSVVSEQLAKLLSNPVTASGPAKPRSTEMKPTRELSVLSSDELRFADSPDPTERVEYVETVLELLHTTEFVVLVEYTEVMIPILYCLYLLVMRHLPNRVYYAQLKDVDDAKLQQNIGNILLYASLELVSFLLLSWFLGRRLKISAIHQLAFVLERQWPMVQSKVILWVMFTVQSSLEHFGVDYSFQFKWLKHQA